MYAAPSIWPSTEGGLSARPQSCASVIRSTVTTPVSRSTLTSATAAWYEYAGVGPTPDPLKSPEIPLGGLYEPTETSVPFFDSARTAASANDMLFAGSARSYTRRYASATRSAGTSSFAATASTMSARRRPAASRTALPAMKVTRLEYEPRSTGASEVSPDTTWTSSV